MKQLTRRHFGTTAAAAAASGWAPASALAQAPSPFERKTIHFYVGIPPGGAYDLVPRIFASHMGKHIPGNPTIVVENMPGAASLTMMNYLYNRAAKDGTAVLHLSSPGDRFRRRPHPRVGLDVALRRRPRGAPPMVDIAAP